MTAPAPPRKLRPPVRVAADLLTVEEAAERLNMSVRYVRRLIDQRRIPFHRIGRSIRIKSTDIDEHIESGRVEPLTASAVWRGLRRVV